MLRKSMWNLFGQLLLLIQLLVHGLPPSRAPDLVPDQRGVAHDETECADYSKEPSVSEGTDKGFANDGTQTCGDSVSL